MKRFLAAVIVLALATPAMAQGGGPPSPPAASVLAGEVQLNVSGTSANVKLPSAAVLAYIVSIFNHGAQDAYFLFGAGTSVAAGTANTAIPAGKCLALWKGTSTYLAGITASGTSQFLIYQGTGPLCPQ